jgi:hypothetical protein
LARRFDVMDVLARWRGPRPEGGILNRRIRLEALRRGRTGSEEDVLQLSETVVPMPDASMRVLEFMIALAAIAAAVLLGLLH